MTRVPHPVPVTTSLFSQPKWAPARLTPGNKPMIN